jgi:hypothetical protein
MEAIKEQAMQGKMADEILQEEYGITDEDLENDPDTKIGMEKLKQLKLSAKGFKETPKP